MPDLGNARRKLGVAMRDPGAANAICDMLEEGSSPAVDLAPLSAAIDGLQAQIDDLTERLLDAEAKLTDISACEDEDVQ